MSDLGRLWLIAKGVELGRRLRGLFDSGPSRPRDHLREKFEEVEQEVHTARLLALGGAPEEWAYLRARMASDRLEELERQLSILETINRQQTGPKCINCGDRDDDGGYCPNCQQWYCMGCQEAVFETVEGGRACEECAWEARNDFDRYSGEETGWW